MNMDNNLLNVMNNDFDLSHMLGRNSLLRTLRNRMNPGQRLRNDQNGIAITLNSVDDQPTDLVIKVADNVICVKGNPMERQDNGDLVERPYRAPKNSSQGRRSRIFQSIAQYDHNKKNTGKESLLQLSEADNIEEVPAGPEVMKKQSVEVLDYHSDSGDQ